MWKRAANLHARRSPVIAAASGGLRPHAVVASLLFHSHVARVRVEDVMPIAMGPEREEIFFFRPKESLSARRSRPSSRERRASTWTRLLAPLAPSKNEHDVLWFWLKKLGVIGGASPDGHDDYDQQHH
ncbi:hypothetical protein ACP70R_041882 [Stipagrostis hirtigluma subsp. patula]